MAVDVWSKEDVARVLRALAASGDMVLPGYGLAIYQMCLAFGVPTITPKDLPRYLTETTDIPNESRPR